MSVSVGLAPKWLSLLAEGLCVFYKMLVRPLLSLYMTVSEACLKNGVLVEVTFPFSA